MELKVAIVTGGGRGIGLAITGRLMERGYTVCVLGRSPEADYAEGFAPLRAHGELFYMQGDIGEQQDREAFVSEVMRRYRRIDVLVNNAGVAPKLRKDILETDAASFDYVLGINLYGTMFITQLVANAMLSVPAADDCSPRGTIINISSFSATVSSTNRPEYCVSKAGISMLTKLYADRLASSRIYVYEIQPGIIRTDMTSKVTAKYDSLLGISDPAATSAFPIRRWGTPADIANAVEACTSNLLSYTTGQVLYIDGGFMNVRSI